MKKSDISTLSKKSIPSLCCWFLSIGLFFFAGCTLGPNYKRPNVSIPIHYNQWVDDSSGDVLALGVWWKQFNDPMLNTLIEEALCCNYTLLMALGKIEEARGLYKIEASKLYPQIQRNLLATRSRRSATLDSGDVVENSDSPAVILPNEFSGPLVENFFQIGFDVNWEIDLWGKWRRSKEAAQRDIEAAQEEALGVQVMLVSEVAKQYVEICSLQELIAIKKEQIQKQQELLFLAKSRSEAGIRSSLNTYEVETELATEQAELPPLEEALEKRFHAIAILLGKHPEGFSFSPGKMPMAVGKLPQTLPSELLCRRPDIRKAEKELAAATARIGVAKADLFPSFSLLSSFGVQSNTLDNLFEWKSRYWTIGPGIIWNLFTGGRLRAQVKVQNERQKIALLGYEKKIIEALQEVEDHLSGYIQESKKLGYLEDKTSEKSLIADLTFSTFEAGLHSLDLLLEKEQELFSARMATLESQKETMIQLISLYKALGGGWEEEKK